MRKLMFAALVALLVLMLVVVGCTPTEAPTEPAPEATEAVEPEPEPTEAAEPEPEATEEEAGEPAGALRAGMVSDVGGIDDASFNQNTWEGLLMAQEELGVEVQFIESQAQADYEKNITEFAEQDYDLIFTVGFLLNDATAKMAPLYPEVSFAGIDQWYDPPIENAVAATFAVDEASFPIGYLAAGWADLQDPDDPQVGWIGGMEIPPVQQFIVAYEAGVAHYNAEKGKDVQVKGVYVGDFEAPDEGKIQGQSLIDEGVDVIFGVGGKTGNGGLAAAKESGKWGVGVDVDQYFTLPNEKDILITSCMKRLDNAVFGITEAMVNGEFPGGDLYVGTLTNAGVGLAPYHDFEDQIPGDLKQEVEAIQEGIVDGTIWTGWGEPPEGATEPAEEPSTGIRAGMVSDVGGIDDASFNQNTWEGLLMAQDELGVEVQFIESQAQADYERNITEFAEQGYDLIFTVGFLLNDATAKMAPLYPDQSFAGIDQWYDPPIDNAVAATFAVDEAAFPIGYLAAGWADLQDPDDPQVGWIGGMEIPPVQQFIVAYEAGVARYNAEKDKDVQVKGVYVGDFEAPDEGKIQGQSLIDEGVDVIFGVGGKTGNGGLAAAKESGKWGVGVDVDQYYTLPNEKDILITSCMKRLDNAVFGITEALVNGEFPGGNLYVGTLTNAGVGLAPYHDFEDQIPDDLKQEVEAIQQGIVDGTIWTGWGEPPEGAEAPMDKPGAGIRAGMVSDVGGIDDASFNQNTWEGLLMAQEQLGVEVQFIESQAQADYERNITEFAEQGYDLIFTVGFLLNDATAKMAPLYPEQSFAGIDQWYDPPIDNAVAATFAVDEAAFPIGYLAAGWADLQDPDDPQVGWIGGMEIPPVQQFIVAYEAGVAHYNAEKGKDVQVKGVYVGDFEAPDEGKIQGQSLIDEGVDVIFGVGGKTGNGGLAAAKESGKWGVGVDVDQYYTLPNEKDILLTSCMKRLDNAVFGVTEALVNGEFPGGDLYVGTLTNAGVGLAPYHDFEDQIPGDLKQEVEAIQQAIIDGTLSTGWPPEG